VDGGEAGDETDLLGDEIEEAVENLAEGAMDGLGAGPDDLGEVASESNGTDGAAAEEEGELLQPVDVEVESRIIPRSE
jgi:hypothetical protein